MKVGIKIRGLAELDALLRELPRAVARQAMAAPLLKGGAVLRDEARANVKRQGLVRTGEMAASIQARRDAKRLDQFGVVVGPTGPGFPLVFHEFGTSELPARPVLRPAYDAKAGEAAAVIGRSLGPAVEKLAARLAAGKLGRVGARRQR